MAAMIRLLDLPHAEARRLLATGVPVYLTVNPVEYHGPHLSLHNDRLISEGVVRALHERLLARHPEWPFVTAGDLDVGVEPCPGRGTHAVRFPVVRELVVGACQALVDLGARRVVIMTFHGSPLHNLAIEAGVTLLRAAGVRAFAPFPLVHREMLTIDPERYRDTVAHIADPVAREALLASLPLDLHAGFAETSLALHFAPQSVAPEHRSLPPCPSWPTDRRADRASRAAAAIGADELASELRFVASALGWMTVRPFPGYTGNPALATAEAGACFARVMLDRCTEAAEEVFAGRAESPAPIMRWLGPLSLGGRVGAPPPMALDS